MGRASRKQRQYGSPPAGQSTRVQPHGTNSPWKLLVGGFTRGALLIAVGAIVTLIITDSWGSRTELAHRPASLLPSPEPAIDSVRAEGPRTVWQLLALPDEELEKVDVVELNLAVARGIPGLEDLDVGRYQRIVDEWANQIKSRLPSGEAVFHQAPEKWQSDIRFFRLGQLAGYLDQAVGIEYIEEQKNLDEVWYTDPGDLFLHGLIDSKEGTCGNMPTLHVAIGRRLGWPVSLAAVRSHTVCRYDDGQVIYNIEATRTDTGGTFSAGSDGDYIEKFNLPERAVTSGSDLHSMTARQMLGYFISLRARHFADTGRMGRADRDYALARALLPDHRRTYIASIEAALIKGTKLFEPTEVGHPLSLSRALNAQFAPRHARRSRSPEDMFAEIERINAINRMRRQRMMQPPAMSADPYAPGFPGEYHNHNHMMNPYGPPGPP